MSRSTEYSCVGKERLVFETEVWTLVLRFRASGSTYSRTHMSIVQRALVGYDILCLFGGNAIFNLLNDVSIWLRALLCHHPSDPNSVLRAQRRYGMPISMT